MKHRIFKTATSLVLVVLMVISMMPAITIASSAAENKVKYTFSDYTAGTQYAKDEVHVLDDRLTVTTTDAHFTTQLRLYSSTTNDGYAIFKSTTDITSIVLNAGNKKDILNVYTSTDGSNWTLANAVEITSTSYNDYTVDFSESTKYIKLDVAGTNQVRIAYITVTYFACSHENKAAIGEAKDATCGEDGITAGVKCSDCGETITAQETIPATGAHNFSNGTCTVCGAADPDACAHANTTVLEAVEAKCTETGLTEGLQCSDCEEILTAQETIDALGHTKEIDAAVAATCTTTGLTEGSHCSACEEVLVEQTVVDALGHSYANGACSVCGEAEPAKYSLVTSADSLKAGDKLILAFTEKKVAMGAISTTSTTYGTTVNVTIADGVLTEADGIKVVTLEAGENSTWALKTDAGYLTWKSGNSLAVSDRADYWTISITASGEATITHATTTTRVLKYNTSSPRFACYTSGQSAPNIYKFICNHVTETVQGTPATCTEDGLTDGVKCTVCGEILTAQETIPATGHTDENPVDSKCDTCGTNLCTEHVWVDGDVIEPATCTKTGLQAQVCENCSEPGEDKVLEMIAHTPETDAAVDATCTATGLTEGSHCSVCKEVLVEQTEVPMVAHDYVDGTCSVCGDIVVTGDQLAEFQFGENGNAEHKDGSTIKAEDSYTNNDYTLKFDSFTNVYDGAFDAKGNSALKLGTGSAAASFSFTVPSNVNTVVIYVAGYKANTAKVDVNGTEYEITSKSDEGAYTKIVVDTTSNKTVTLTTLSGGYRAMLNSIEFWGKSAPAAETASFKSVSLSLDGMIGVTIKVAGWQDGYSVKFKLGDGTEETFEKASFTRWINASEMLETITVTLYGDDGETELDIQTFNAETYVDAVKAQYASDTKLCALVDALLTYGKYAAVYMGDTVADLGDLSAPSFEGLGVTVSASATGYTAKAVLNEACDLVISLPVGFNGTLTVNGEEVTPVNNSYTIETIAAQNWADRYHIVATVGNETMLDVTMSVLDYLATAINQGLLNTNEATNLAYAMYSLNAAADEYLNKAAE